jgi:hypothetical protein
MPRLSVAFSGGFMPREFRTVGVVGLGTMGAGIVEVFARNGLQVVGVEPSDDALVRGRGHLQSSTDRAVKRGKLAPEEQEAIFGRITFSTSLEDLVDADLVIEAVPEHLDLKQDVFSRLDKICRPDTILATNTSSLSVTEISVATTRPGHVIGMHFFNPAPVLKLVEVVRTVVTSRRSSTTSWHSPGSWARCPSSSATRPGSSPTRCCSATSTTPSRCTSRATRRVRTSTPPCASGAGCPWGRCRCST